MKSSKKAPYFLAGGGGGDIGIGEGVPLDCHDDRDVPWLVNLLYPPLLFSHSCSCGLFYWGGGIFPQNEVK